MRALGGPEDWTPGKHEGLLVRARDAERQCAFLIAAMHRAHAAILALPNPHGRAWLERIAGEYAASLVVAESAMEREVAVVELECELSRTRLDRERAERDERLQGEMRRLSWATALLGPAIVVFGFWGMNFGFFDPGTWLSGIGQWTVFWASIALVAVITALAVMVPAWKRRRVPRG